MSGTYVEIPVGGVINWKESVADIASLPASNNTAGDARVVLDISDIYIWSGSAWVAEGLALGVSDTASVDLTLSGATLSAVVLPAGVDHGGLAGLADDDHTRYFQVTGRTNETLVLNGTGVISNQLGLETAPSYSFTNDLNTGMWSSTAGKIDFSINGENNLRIEGALPGGDLYAKLTWIDPSNSANNRYITSDDSSGVGLKYDTGSASGRHAFFVGGVDAVTMTQNLIALYNQTLIESGGTVSAPDLTFFNGGSLNTGLYSSAADTIDFAAGGVKKFTVDSTGANLPVASKLSWGSAGSPSIEGGSLNLDIKTPYTGKVNFTTNGTTNLRIQRDPIGGDGYANLIFIDPVNSADNRSISSYDGTTLGLRYDVGNVSGRHTFFIQNADILTLLATTIRLYQQTIMYNGGTASAPSLSLHNGGTFNTGFYPSDDNIIGVSTAGFKRLEIDSTGVVLSTNSAPASTTDEVTLGSVDISVGNRTLAISTETAVGAAPAAADASLIVFINGNQYKIHLTAIP